MTFTRKESLGLIGAALLMPSCSGRSGNGAVSIASKNFGESNVTAEIYAAALERAGIRVERHMNLGATQIVMGAMERGDIDLYPEYTGTALIDVLHMPPMRDANALYRRVRSAYRARYGLEWLNPSPANDSQGLCVTATFADRHDVRTLSQCAQAASDLRFAGIPEFVTRADALPGLQRFYGGFHFRDVKTFDIGLQYDALVRGDADVATAFTTDSEIETDRLVLLEDDKHFWPAYNIAPVVRSATLKAHPQIAAVLNKIAPFLTDSVVRNFNYQFNVKKTDAAEIAKAFLAEHAG